MLDTKCSKCEVLEAAPLGQHPTDSPVLNAGLAEDPVREEGDGQKNGFWLF